MAVRIRLKRMGKIRAPFYRVVVMDSRAKRDGRAIEEIGKYHPTESHRSSTSTPSARSTGSASAPSRASRSSRCSGDRRLGHLQGRRRPGRVAPGRPAASKKDLTRPPSRLRAPRSTPRAGRRRRGRPPPAKPTAEARPPRPRSRTPPGRRRSAGLSPCSRKPWSTSSRGIVDHDEDVVVRRRDLRRGTVLSRSGCTPGPRPGHRALRPHGQRDPYRALRHQLAR